MSMPTAQPVLDPWSAEFRADPYRLYADLHRAAPVHWSDPLHAWVFVRYRDALTILRDSCWKLRPAIGFQSRQERAGNLDLVAQVMEQVYAFMDPPGHTRLRSLTMKAFTPHVVEKLRLRIQSLAESMVDELSSNGPADFMQTLAYPLPVVVITELLGVAEQDRADFLERARHLGALLEWDAPPERLGAGGQAMFESATYFGELIERRRREPGGDLMTRLLQAEDEGEHLSDGQILTICSLLLTVGYETTMNLLGNGTCLLLTHDQAREELRADPALVPRAIDEMLRFEPPVQMTSRIALADVEVGGVTVREGEQVVVVLAAASRDPDQVPEPDRFDIRRSDSRHLAFGYGVHFCLGAALARLEAEIVFTTLLRRRPGIRLVEPPSWRQTLTLRALVRLVVAA